MTLGFSDRIRSGTTDPLARALDRTSGARAIPGNAVAHLVDGPATFERLLDRIAAAEQWIHLENYIVRGDRTGHRFAEALRAARRRGVHVSVLYDHFGSWGTPRRYWSRLRDAGVRVRAFGPPRLRTPLAYFQRDHRKYVGIDGRVAVVGGICIGDEWAGDPARGLAPWRDSAIEICGPAVSALELSFLRLWSLAQGPPPPYTVRTDTVPCGATTIRVVEGAPGRLRLYRTMEFLCASAAERVWITDAYLVPLSPLFRTIMATAQAGVDVRLLLPGRTDLPAVRALARVGYRELLESRVRIWEWRGPVLHAKTALVDDDWYKVGSSNLNPTSLLGNYELDVLVSDPAVVGVAVQQFRRDFAHAVEVVLRPRRLVPAWRVEVPPAVVKMEDAGGSPPRRTAGALRQRTVLALRHVALGAQRSITGAVLFVSFGAGVLLLALPTLMSYVLAGMCFGLGLVAVWRYLELRRARRE